MIELTISDEDRIYREFACWVARRAARLSKCRSDYPIVLVVEKYLKGEITFDEVIKAREAAHAGALGASVVGISRGVPSAAAEIAASCCAEDSAKKAAEDAIQFGALTATLATSKYNRSAGINARKLLEEELSNRLKAFQDNRPF